MGLVLGQQLLQRILQVRAVAVVEPDLGQVAVLRPQLGQLGSDDLQVLVVRDVGLAGQQIAGGGEIDAIQVEVVTSGVVEAVTEASRLQENTPEYCHRRPRWLSSALPPWSA